MKSRPTSYPRPLPKTLPGLEIEQAVARMMDRADLWWRALAIFHAHYGKWIDTWHLAQCAPETERQCVHALRSSASNVGADRLAAAAAALENALMASSASPATLASMRSHLQACFSEVLQSITSALTSEVRPTMP